MKAKLLCLILTLAMLASLTAVLAVSVSADSGDLQVCTDCVEVNGVGHESTSDLPADTWFDQTYGDRVVDEDGTIRTFYLRGWANPLDGSDLLQYGYSLKDDTIQWDDSIKIPEAGLHGYFPKAERFELTLDLAALDVGTYEFHLYAKTSSGVYEVMEESFIFEKKAATVAEEPTEAPTEAPTEEPTAAPTEAPTEEPTEAPTDAPTEAPTAAPTEAPTDAPATGADTTADTAADNESATVAAADEGGCASVMSAAALLTLLCGVAVVLKRKN